MKSMRAIGPVITVWIVFLGMGAGAVLRGRVSLAQSSLSSSQPIEVPNPAFGAHIVEKIPGTGDPTIAGFVIPPAPIPLDWARDQPFEHGIEATHIKFDHKASGTDDVLNIRWTKDTDLDHKGDGAGSGEYVPDKDRNEPVCYVRARKYTVKVRFEAKMAGAPSQVLATA